MAIPAASVPQERIAAVRHFTRSRPHFPALKPRVRSVEFSEFG